MGRGRHANPAAGAFGGAPYGAAILVRGVPKWGGAAMRTLPLGPSVEFHKVLSRVAHGGTPSFQRTSWSELHLVWLVWLV